MFVHPNFTVKAAFRQRAVDSFRSGADEVDFRSENEAARQAINQWVEAATQGKIRNLFAAGQLSQDSVLVLVNAIYFKGEWLKAFKPNQTVNEPFHSSSADSVQGSSMRMLILLPDEVDGLPRLEENLDSINFTALNFYPWEVEIKMPKFKIESKLALKEPLSRLGVTDLFTPSANLSGLTDVPNVSVSKVLQKAFVEVNEKGTEAAVATAVEFVARSGRRRISFTCDHPFLFFIQGADRTILFMGRVASPSAAASPNVVASPNEA
ncbi:ACYPI002244 protein [Gryllus bimaculatus]|nr:ACYPI002244 protein [Gryllus bimaculatus]